MQMEKYIVVIEKSSTGFSAFSPDAPGCITVGETVEGTIENMREALDLYIEATAEAGSELPKGKGIEYHINNGLLKDGEIADEYFLTQVEIELPEWPNYSVLFLFCSITSFKISYYPKHYHIHRRQLQYPVKNWRMGSHYSGG